jgi:hypothetical protein
MRHTIIMIVFRKQSFWRKIKSFQFFQVRFKVIINIHLKKIWLVGKPGCIVWYGLGRLIYLLTFFRTFKGKLQIRSNSKEQFFSFETAVEKTQSILDCTGLYWTIFEGTLVNQRTNPALGTGLLDLSFLRAPQLTRGFTPYPRSHPSENQDCNPPLWGFPIISVQ